MVSTIEVWWPKSGLDLVSLGSISQECFGAFFEPPCTFRLYRIAIARLHSRHAGSPTKTGLSHRCLHDEAHTRQSQKMEVVGQLASGIAHDFRHIPSVIIGNLELLMLRHAADADDRTALGRAMDAATHGVAVIQSMMHFVRKTAPNPRIVDLNDAINTTLLHQAVVSRIALVQLPATSPSLVKVDQTQLELALLNIVLNARDAMPNGGTVTIVTQTVTLNGEHGLTGDYASVLIRDTGTGIPPDVLENVLTPFFTTEVEEEGTGLGLSMVDDFAKEYQGAVAINSVVGEGTTVTIFLPTPYHSCDFQPACGRLMTADACGRATSIVNR
jgi:signal transduction histidine kinase